MANIKLATIAHRQRTYLFRDLIVAVLMVLFVVFQVSAFTTSRGAASASLPGDLPAFTTHGASHGSAASGRAATVSAGECSDPSVC